MHNFVSAYQEMADEELMELATQLRDLTPEAQTALQNELEKRQIQQNDVKEHVVRQTAQELQRTIKLPDMPKEQIRSALQAGGRCILFHYCVSCVFWSFKMTSPMKVIKPEELDAFSGIKYSLLSLLLGWWGVPWGPIWTISTVIKNVHGGTDVTEEVEHLLFADDLAERSA